MKLSRTLLSESDARFRQLERDYQLSGDEHAAHAWATEALRRGGDPVHIGQTILRSHPDLHDRMADDLWRHNDHRKYTEFTLPVYMKRYVDSVNSDGDSSRRVVPRRRPLGYLTDLVNDTNRHRSALMREVGNLVGIRTVTTPAEEEQRNQAALRYLMQYPHDSDRSKIRTIAHIHDARYQEPGYFSGTSQNVHYVYADPDAEHASRSSAESIQSMRRDLETHLPGASTSIHYGPEHEQFVRVDLPHEAR